MSQKEVQDICLCCICSLLLPSCLSLWRGYSYRKAQSSETKSTAATAAKAQAGVTTIKEAETDSARAQETEVRITLAVDC